MKRSLIVAAAVVSVALIGSYVVFAQPQGQTATQPQNAGPGMMQGGPGEMMGQPQGPRGMGQGMMQSRMRDHLQGGCPMCEAMIGSMVLKTMIPTQDGGVIIAFGNKLMRYDNQLNLLKETEMKVDAGQMYSDMQKMVENCPAYRQMQQQQPERPPAQARP
jgi:hypothetical protein